MITLSNPSIMYIVQKEFWFVSLYLNILIFNKQQINYYMLELLGFEIMKIASVNLTIAI